LTRHLRLNNSFLLIIIPLLLLTGCNRKEEKREYVAKVNDSYLSEDDLTAVSGGYGGHKSFKEEMIRSWVNRELLYQEALKQGITDTEEFSRIMRVSEKELAAAMMLEKIYADKMPVYKSDDLKLFYEQNQEIFKVNHTAYIVNKAEFSNENKAVNFRTAAVESNWNKSLNFLKNDPALLNEESNIIINSYDLLPARLNRVLSELNPGEVSLVINSEQGNYLVVELINRLQPGTLPPYDIIKENVESRFLTAKRAETLKEYFEDLYAENEIDVKQ
jgi:hypothetical protein